MSHFTVMVIGDNPEDQLAPYQENNMGTCPEEFLEFRDETEYLRKNWDEMSAEEKKEYDNSFEKYAEDEGYEKHPERDLYGCYSNPNARWDWYQLGGRWTGFLKLKENATGEIGEPGLMTLSASEGFADQALKMNIDFEGMRKYAEEEAGKLWNKVNKILKGAEKPHSWEHVREIMFPGDISAAREFYHSQEANKRIDEWNKKHKHSLFGVNSLDFMTSKEEYCKEDGNSAISTFAVLKDGVWYEKGEMGWFGMTSNEKDQNEWNTQVALMLESLPDDTLISIYDCHI